MNPTIDMQQEHDRIFEQLKQFIADIIGEDVFEELSITKDSTFTRDLEMDSIEIVAFAEKVKAEYGSTIDFTSWLASMELEDLIKLSLNDIVDFIVKGLHPAE